MQMLLKQINEPTQMGECSENASKQMSPGSWKCDSLGTGKAMANQLITGELQI